MNQCGRTRIEKLDARHVCLFVRVTNVTAAVTYCPAAATFSGILDPDVTYLRTACRELFAILQTAHW